MFDVCEMLMTPAGEIVYHNAEHDPVYNTKRGVNVSEEFINWFNEHIKETMFLGREDERENLMAFCWLAWRDSRRELSNKLNLMINS
ncbi:MAG: hypothetical protein ACRDDY_13165 [Clostridium sp.]